MIDDLDDDGIDTATDVSENDGAYRLKRPIIRRTKDRNGDVQEEELQPRGLPVPLRRAQANDLEFAERKSKNDVQMTMFMLVRLSPLDLEEVGLLDMEDFAALGELSMGSLPSGPKTGESA